MNTDIIYKITEYQDIDDTVNLLKTFALPLLKQHWQKLFNKVIDEINYSYDKNEYIKSYLVYTHLYDFVSDNEYDAFFDEYENQTGEFLTSEPDNDSNYYNFKRIWIDNKFPFYKIKLKDESGETV